MPSPGKEENCWAQHKSTGKPLISFAGRICSYRNNRTQASTRKNLHFPMFSILTSIPMCSTITAFKALDIQLAEGLMAKLTVSGTFKESGLFHKPRFPKRLQGIQRDPTVIWRPKHSFCSNFCIQIPFLSEALSVILLLPTSSDVFYIFISLFQPSFVGSLPPRPRNESWCLTTTCPVSILKSCCTQQPCKIMKSKLSKLKYVYLRSCKNVFPTSNERRLAINCTHSSCYTLPQTTFDVSNSYIHILKTNSPAAPFKLWGPGFHLHL